jgi:hypothetical protein
MMQPGWYPGPTILIVLSGLAIHNEHLTESWHYKFFQDGPVCQLKPNEIPINITNIIQAGFEVYTAAIIKSNTYILRFDAVQSSNSSPTFRIQTATIFRVET